MPDDAQSPGYSAKTAYTERSAVRYEERDFYRGLLGRFRKRAEVRAIRRLTGLVPEGSEFLDCPCGNGRWFEILSRRASRIVAMDVSEGMRGFASRRAAGMGAEIEVLPGDAEDLPLEDDSVDYTFSYALMKHLPVPVQYRVVREFGRVSRRGVICSFGVLRHLSYEFWRRRGIAESYPVFVEEIGWMATEAGLELKRVVRCSTPIGLEHLVYMQKIS